MTEKQAVKELVKLCERLSRETPEIKNNYYDRLKEKIISSSAV